MWAAVKVVEGYGGPSGVVRRDGDTGGSRTGSVRSGSSRCVGLARTLFDPFKVDDTSLEPIKSEKTRQKTHKRYQ